MAYESLIGNTEIIQGDSSDIYMFTIDGEVLPPEFTARFVVSVEFCAPPIIKRDILRNDAGEFPADTHFVFQLTPADTSILVVGEKYLVSVEITNESISYNAEVAQFRLKILPQGVC